MLQQASKGEEDLQKYARNIVQYARAKGYDFTEEEARAWLAERAGGELKDAQLDAVAGGAGYIKSHAAKGPTPHMSQAMGDGSVMPAGQHGTGGGAGLAVMPSESRLH